MPLATGTRLGPYEILGPLGAGGMGEVYRARDTKLDRDVAVKVLPPDLAESPAALARFEREAKAVAALSHPNILAIFDFGAERGTAYAVMELLEGATLRETLADPLPPRKAIAWAIQIARGLAAAHDKGIVHRDLKPENVFVTTDGRVKILDFGLARHAAGALSGRGDASMTPTIESGTLAGTVLGTVGYMSPEQARGEPGDSRSDLFAFGAVLYEMVSGRRAFQRETAVETLTATLRDDPPELSGSGAAVVPPALARVIHHCLEKNPVERFQSARDVAFALDALSGATTTSTMTPVSEAPVRSRRFPWPAAAAAVLVAAAGAFFAGRLTAPVPRHPTFTTLTFQPEAIFRALFAPDGKTIVFSAARKGDDVELYSVSPEYPESRNFGLRDAQLLSISSKSELAILTHARYVAQRLFVGTLARLPLGGGAPREILENVREADWSPDGASLAIIREAGGRDRLEFPAGKVLVESAGYLSDLRVSPDGARIAFFEHPSRYDDRGAVAVVDLAGKKTTLSDGYNALEGLAWSRDGREVLFSGYTIFAVTLAGRLREVLESAGGLTLDDISADGRLLASRDDVHTVMMARAPGASDEANLSWLDSSTVRTLSADGRQLLFTEFSYAAGDTYAVCLRKTDGSPVVRLGEGAAYDLSADGKWALAHVPGAHDRLVVYPTGAGEARSIDIAPLERTEFARWFADGTHVLVCGNEAGKLSRCYVKDLNGGAMRAVTPDDTHAGYASPDGRVLLVRGGGDTPDRLYPLDGGAPRPAAGLEKDDAIIRWNGSGRSVIVSRGSLPVRLEQVDVDTGRRELIREIEPRNAVGVLALGRVTTAADPGVYAYGVIQRLSSLFMIQGAR